MNTTAATGHELIEARRIHLYKAARTAYELETAPSGEDTGRLRARLAAHNVTVKLIDRELDRRRARRLAALEAYVRA